MSVPSLTNTNTEALKFRIGKVIDEAQMDSIKIATGDRIIKAYEDAAGLAIGTGLDTNVQILKAALTSTQQAISVLNIADGGAKSIVNVVKRLSQLQIMSLAGSATDDDRELIQIEASKQLEEIQRIATSTDFNGRKLLNGSIAAGNDFTTSITGTEAKSTLDLTLQDSTSSVEFEGVTLKINKGTAGPASISKGLYESKTLTVEAPTTLAKGDAFEINFNSQTFKVAIDDTADESKGGSAPTSATKIAPGIYQSNDKKTVTAYLNIKTGDSSATPPATKTDPSGVTFADIASAITKAGFDTSLGANIKVKEDNGNLTFKVEDNKADPTKVFDKTSGALQAAYQLEVKTPPTNFKVAAGSATPTAAAVTAADLQGGPVLAGDEITINVASTATAAEIATALSNFISNPSLPGMNERTKTALSLINTSTDNETLKIAAKQRGVAGLVVAKVDDAVVHTSSYQEGFTSGSLGVSNVKAFGSASGAFKIGDVAGLAATTDNIELDGKNYTAGDVIKFAGREIKLVNALSRPDVTDEVEIGKDNGITTKNIVRHLQDSNDPAFKNFNYEYQFTTNSKHAINISTKGSSVGMNGIEFKITTKVGGTPTDYMKKALGGAKADVINTSRVTDNPNFLGKLNDVTAELVGETINVKVNVGPYIYQGSISKTLLSSSIEKPLLLKSNVSDHGGYFSVNLAADYSLDVQNQDDADNFANKMQESFRTITFYQDRAVDTFKPEGTMIEGTIATYSSQKFDKLSVSSVEVKEATLDTETNKVKGEITLKLNDGREFSTKYIDKGQVDALGIGKQISTGEEVVLKRKIDDSDESSNYEQIALHFGQDVDFTQKTMVQNLQTALSKSFQADHKSMDFQVGASPDQKISVALGSVQVKDLGLDGISLTSMDAANAAGPKIEQAKKTMIAYRSDIGAMQSRFNYASEGIASSIENMDAARATFLDANITQQAENFSKANATLAASIAVDAQMLQIPQNLLRLVTSL